MEGLRRFYHEVWLMDFEFYQPEGERPVPLCMAARELWSQRSVHLWLEGRPPPPPPWTVGAPILHVAYYASAEVSCFLALDWPVPQRLLDLYVEFRCLHSGLTVPAGSSLLGALTAYGLPGLAASTKEDMRDLARRGPPYSAAERTALQTYCATDIAALADLLPAMLPSVDLPRALLRGRYMVAAARMEWQGTPLDVDTLTVLREQWNLLRRRLAQTINRTHPVFIPTGTTLDPQSRLGAVILQTARRADLDPYHLAVAVEHAYHESRDLYGDTLDARRTAQTRTGLTPAQIARWERAGHDASSWPGLDALAVALVEELPMLGLGAVGGATPAEALWEILRTTEVRPPQRQDPAILRRAVDLARDDPEGLAWDGAMTFSTERFAQYLAHHEIPWPRLPSGALCLDDDTLKEMAKAYPTDIGPIRDVRYTLSQLKLRDLAVGSDGRNRCLLSAFGSRSSRNQPSNSRYIFGPSTWLRSLIKPAPGRALGYCDWSQQELAIAAYFSQDPVMMEAYRSGDFYLTFAKMAGAAPPDATKTTHAAVREHFKVVCLGVLYGLSEFGLARRLDVPLSTGRWLLRRHKEVFHRYWAWSEQIEMQGMLGGTLRTVFGWQMHAGREPNPRSLRNFPMQAHGGEMLRLACCLCTEHGIQVCGPVHDALLIEASLEAIESVVAQTQAFMEQASLVVLPGFPLRTDAKIVRYPERYADPRGTALWETVQTILDETQEAVPF